MGYITSIGGEGLLLVAEYASTTGFSSNCVGCRAIFYFLRGVMINAVYGTHLT